MPVMLYVEERSTGTEFLNTGVTLTDVEALRDRVAATPVTVIDDVFGKALSAAVRVIMLDVAVSGGSNDAVTPEGSPDTLSFAGSVRVPRRIKTTRVLMDRPCGIDSFGDEIEIVKSGGPTFADGRTSYSG